MTPTPTPPPAAARRVLVIVDPAAPSPPALAKAARLARALRAGIELYACDPLAGGEGSGRARALARRRAVERGEAALWRLARAELGARRVAVRYELGHPRAARVLAYVRRTRPGLVVIESHFHRGLRRALFGASDWPLIRDCAVPLLYAKPGRWPAAPRIAAAVDPLHPADPRARLDAALVGAAHALARGLGGSLAVVHAWLPLEAAVAGPALLGLPLAAAAVEERLADAEAGAARALAALCRGRRRPRAEPVLLAGAAVETLPAWAARAGVDVLALGAVSRSRLYEALIGATAERLLERVPCDLLVVKARRARAPGRRPARRGARRRIPV
ncbi:MAG TPA: universal stress protein [Steroidobacteraceae bacterium]|nr:universal stress protein [Steroidobacteraceae bacterium]